jgi:hypothetical protein
MWWRCKLVGSLLIISVLYIAVVVIIISVAHFAVTFVITTGNVTIVLWCLDASNTSITRRWGTISTIRTSNCALIQETIPVKRFCISPINIVVWGLLCLWFIFSPNLASKCPEDTIIIIIAIIIIAVVIIFLALCFLPIVVEVWILWEDVVIVPVHSIYPQSLAEEFGIGVDVHQCLGFVNPKVVATFVANKWVHAPIPVTWWYRAYERQNVLCNLQESPATYPMPPLVRFHMSLSDI